MTFSRPAAADDPQWPRASAWLEGPPSQHHPPLVVVGVPCSIGSISPSRASRTPPAVREALARLSPFDAVTDTNVAAMVEVADLGDWAVEDLPLQPALDAIRQASGALDRDAVHVFLGGDNAITRPLVTGLLGPDLARVGVLTLDAHHDVRHLDDGPRNGTPIRGLLADGLPGHNVVQLGIGSFTNSAAYAAWCTEHGITTIPATDVHARGIDACLAEALTRLNHCDLLFVDLDVDVLDVAFAPACPGARPGGLTPDQLLTAARALGAEPRVRAMDLVEVDATTDHDGRTVMVTAMALLAFASGLAMRPAAAPPP